ncbi:hypothetical protein GJV26_16955 [Massilia dura]|uniref:Uncharacterized protein n=1 Tax=Pseudoduganella dura TaxID=321982 RepID=A0A6I3XIA7_9BURK|nr:hypothetical protein [Pseudoduganella dura]MUI14133.1 hypothetical protein [Pseudoduganella dura]
MTIFKIWLLKLRLFSIKRRRQIDLIKLIIVFGLSITSTISTFWNLSSTIGIAALGVCGAIIFVLINARTAKLIFQSTIDNISGRRTAALSIIYLRRVTNKCMSALLFLTGVSLLPSIVLIAASNFPQVKGYTVADLKIVLLITFGLIILLLAKILVLTYRIRRGYFGGNKSEAREMINFLIANSDSIDFNDPNGGFKRALVPESYNSEQASNLWQGVRL